MGKFLDMLKSEYAQLVQVVNANVKMKDKSLQLLQNKLFILICLVVAIPLSFIAVGSSGGHWIRIVKSGTLNIDGSTTVGNALDNYKYFRSTSWKEFEDQQRRRVVEFNGKIDSKSTIKQWLQSRYSGDVISKLNSKDVSSDIDVNLQFLVNTDSETFKLAYSEVVLNGKIIGRDASHIIDDIYKNKLINDIGFGVGSIYSDEANKIAGDIASKKLEEAKKKYLIDNRSKFVGKYRDAASGEAGKCQLVVKDMNDSFVKIELTIKDTDKKPETYEGFAKIGFAK